MVDGMELCKTVWKMWKTSMVQGFYPVENLGTMMQNSWIFDECSMSKGK